MNSVWVPQSMSIHTWHSIQAIACSKIGTPVVPSRICRPLRVLPSFVAGFENFTNGRVSSESHRLIEKTPLPLMKAAGDPCTYSFLGPLWCCGPVGHDLLVAARIIIDYDPALISHGLCGFVGNALMYAVRTDMPREDLIENVVGFVEQALGRVDDADALEITSLRGRG